MINQPRMQRGIGLWTLMYVIVTLSMFGLIGFKLSPHYFEYLKIKGVLDKVVKSTGASEKSQGELAADIVKRLDVDSVKRISKKNWKDYLDIEIKRQRVTISIAYSAAVPLFLNLSLVASFEHLASH